MNDDQFSGLMKSIKQAGQIKSGEIAASRIFELSKGDDMSEQKPEYDVEDEIEKTPKNYRVYWHDGDKPAWTDVLAIDFWEDDGVLFLRDEDDIVFMSRTWTSVLATPQQ